MGVQGAMGGGSPVLHKCNAKDGDTLAPRQGQSPKPALAIVTGWPRP